MVPIAKAVMLMMQEPTFQKHVASNPAIAGPYKGEGDLKQVAWAYLYHLLYADDLVAAAMILWDEETFTAEPHCVHLVWNALMTQRMICVIGVTKA